MNGEGGRRNSDENVSYCGGGQGGIAILQTLLSIDFVKVIGVVDLNPDAPAISEAEKHGIPTGRQFEPFLDPAPDVVLEVTGDPKVYDRLGEMKHEDTLLISGAVVDLLIRLVEEKKKWFMAYKRRQQELETILDSTHDGMIAVNKEARITLFNRAAERMIGTSAGKVLGKKIEDVIPKSRLEWVLHNGKAELNQKFKLPSGMEILTNRVPVKGQDGKVIGAVSVFRDISELKNMSQQIIDLESMKSLLQAIIDSSEDAISVVDTNGMGILINPAYTRLTGLKPEDIIGKPADTDISEGESMHMKVLRTKKPVRGVQLKVGPHRKEVLVNVAPIMMEGELKASVGIIHDVSEIKRLNRDLERVRRIIRNWRRNIHLMTLSEVPKR